MPAARTTRIEQWVSLSDFTPGIYDNSNISRITPVVPAKLGAADARYTLGCMALNTGGLGPLPKFTTSYDAPTAAATYPFLSGFYAASTYKFGTSDIFLMLLEKTTGSDHYYVWYDYDTSTGTTHTLINGSKAKSGTIGPQGSPFPFMTRLIKSTKGATTKYTPTPTTTPGKPVIIIQAPSGTTAGSQVYMYPDITSPTSHSVLKFPTTGTTKLSCEGGWIIGYQGRVLVLVPQGYTWPGQEFLTNENISYTTPGNTTRIGKQDVVLDPTDPFGYGTWGSISAGELFLVKNRGGGLVLTGDINFPTVTKLPGVQPTGHLFGASAQTPAGLFYCSEDNGAWIWNGGNTSQKISQNIDDGFFYTSTNHLNFFCESWGEWILFSNSWLYNMRLQSWWKLSKPTQFWYYPARTANGFYTACWKRPSTGTGNPVAYKMTKTVPGVTYTWQSLPIKIAQNRYINIRELVLYASNPGTNTSTVNIQLYNETTKIFTYTTTAGAIGADPSMIRIPAGGVTLDNVIVRLVANGASGAPIIHSLTIGINVRQHVETS